MSADATDAPGRDQPLIGPDEPVLVQPSNDPVVVSVSYPTGEHLTTIAQLLVGATEMCIWQDVAELIPVRCMVHEVAWQLDRVAAAGAAIAVTISAAEGHLGVDLRVPVAGEVPVLDTWLMEEARQVFDRIDLIEQDGDLLVSLERCWSTAAEPNTPMS